MKRLERITREHDRPAKDGKERKRAKPEEPHLSESPDGDDGLPHIDVRA